MPPPPPDWDTLTIVGTGLLGCSLGLALKHAGFQGQIVGLGRRQDTLDRAVARGALDRGVTRFQDAIPPSQCVVLAVPLGAFPRVFTQLTPHLGPDILITDVGSTKASVTSLASHALPHPRLFVGGHPMAGSEHSGPDAASATLFHDKPCVLTPTPDTDPDALAQVQALWRAVGMRVLKMTPQEHDRAVAAVSHLPHAAAVLLVQAAQALGGHDPHWGGWDVASTGFRDTTRLASSNPPMRADIMEANRPALLEALAALRSQLDAMEASLRGTADLCTDLHQAKATREAWLRRASK